MMSNQNRELTSKEKRSIKKLVTRLCANYDSEYGCLPLDCDCPMFGISAENQNCRKGTKNHADREERNFFLECLKA